MADEVEVRTLEGLRASSEGGAPKLLGHAIRSGVMSEDLGGFREIIDPQAIPRALDVSGSIVALHNHDANRVLGRSPKTLRLQPDDRGLAFELDVPTHAMDVFESVQRGDATNASFAFTDATDSWDTTVSPPVRTVHSFRLREISLAVPFAAYPQTAVTAAMRSLDRHRQTSPKEAPVPEPVAAELELTPPVLPVVHDARAAVEGMETRGGLLGPKDSVQRSLEQRGLIAPLPHGERVLVADILRSLKFGTRDRRVSEEAQRALGGATDAAGGIFAPDVTSTMVIDHLRNALAVVRAGASTMAITSDLTKIPRVTTDPTVADRAEHGAVSESEPQFEGVSVVPRSEAFYFKVSNELLEDSSPSIEPTLVNIITQAMARRLDFLALYGSGTPPQPRGIATTTGVGNQSMGVNGAALTSWTPILQAIQIMLDANAGFPTGALLNGRTLLNGIARIAEATTNAPMRPPAVIEDLIANRLFVTNAIPNTETDNGSAAATRIFFGVWPELVFAIRTDLRIAVARELFILNQQTAFVATARVDFVVTHPASFSMLTAIEATP